MDYKQWLNNNELAISIWTHKYQYNNETFEQWLDRVSDGDNKVKQLIRDKKFLFGGRILANRGLDERGKKVTYSNCYVLPQVGDSIEDIYKTCSDLARTFSYGGGVGIDISKLRPKGSFVNNTARETSGACSFMDTFSQVTETIGQNGRRGALMISIDCTHPELLDFIDIKNDLNRVTKANISVRVTNEFMYAVINDRDWELYFKTEHEEIRKVVKAKDIFHLLCKNNWNMAEPGILFWDTIENYNLLSEDENFKYAGVNPCAEEPLPAGGSCLLGSINLSEYVQDGVFDIDLFVEDIPVIVRAMNDVLDQGLPLHPLQIQKDTVRDYRQIGIGVMGIADMLIKLGMRYDSDEAIEFCDNLGFVLANETIKASALLAKEFGPYPKYNREAILQSAFVQHNTNGEVYNLISKYGLRNSQLLTIAPTGTLSTMLGISGGIEPIFSLSYTRKTQSLHGEDVYYKVFTPIAEEYMKKHNIENEYDLPDYFVTTQNLDYMKRVEMQGVWQEHIDASISSTVNLPNEATIEDVEKLYIHAWQNGLKGLTIFRDGCARLAVLSTKDKKEDDEVKEEPLKHGTWLPRPDDTIYILKKITTGCSRFNAFIGWSDSEKRVVDLFVRHCSQHGCKSNIDTIAIAFSGMLRLGGKVEYIEKALNGVGICNSYTMAKHKGKPVSKGTSCGTAILNAIKEVEQEQLGLVEKKKETSQPLDIMNKMVKTLKCPECGEDIQASGGCFTCKNCGFSKCD